MNSFYESVWFPILLIVGIVGGCIGFALWAASNECAAQSTKMGVEYSWGGFQGCMIKTPKGWLPLQSYIEIK